MIACAVLLHSQARLSNSQAGMMPCPSICAQPQPDQPLASCNQFERVWSFDPTEWLVRAGASPLSRFSPLKCLVCAGKQLHTHCMEPRLAASC